MRSTASSGSPVQMKREAACSSSSSSARRASSRGHRRPAWPRPAAPAAPRSGSPPIAVARSVRVGELDLDHALDRVGIGARLGGAGRRVRQQPLGVELARLARRRDQAALRAGEARALGPARGDPDRDRLRRLVVDRRAAACGTTGPRSAPARPSRARGSATRPPAAARDARPSPASPTPVGATSFIASPAPSPRKIRPGSEAAERRERLRDDRRVVAVGGREHARADEDARASGRPARRATAARPASARRRAGTAGSDPRRRRCRGRGARRRARTRAGRPARTARRTPCSRGAAAGLREGGDIDSARW